MKPGLQLSSALRKHGVKHGQPTCKLALPLGAHPAASEKLWLSLEHRVVVQGSCSWPFCLNGPHKCILVNLLVNSHRAGGRKPVESRDGRRERVGGKQEKGFPDVSLSTHTDEDRTGIVRTQRKGHSGGGVPRSTPAPGNRTRNSSDFSGTKGPYTFHVLCLLEMRWLGMAEAWGRPGGRNVLICGDLICVCL